MSQKYIKSKNNNSHNAKTYGKYYAKPVYDEKFVETDEIADFIQTQATLKRSDEGRGLHGIDHHLAPYPVPARDRAHRYRFWREERQGGAEVCQYQDTGEGRDLRGTAREPDQRRQ